MNHVMLDLETMGQGSNAAIDAIRPNMYQQFIKH
ncbi:3'-5' exoribonuclease [Pseudoalteromonas sp. DY56-GL79]